tara:strand:+ start:293 stop:952 length:660 start_codon:yes stop_codon:yes gene_type:complete
VKFFKLYFLVILTICPLFGCKNSNQTKIELDNKSYINNFELVQENPNNQTSVKITSPEAIIDPSNNDIEIFESSIEILNENGYDFKIKSGNSTLNNLTNSIRVFNNVNISFIDKEDYYIITNSFDWDLNTSVIDINNPVNINLEDSRIIAMSGVYNIDSSMLKMYNTEFSRNVFNSEGEKEYQLGIKSDFAKWFKNDNALVFTSNQKQVETTINFLFTE